MMLQRKKISISLFCVHFRMEN